MSYNIKGNAEVLRYATSNGKYLGTKVGGIFTSDDSGLIEMDAYSQEEMDEIFSTIPLSKYGTGDYLPPGVAGSFEGASTNPAWKCRTLMLEDNGDLVMLRNGTNGSSRSVYYSYLPNALATTDMNGFISTNKKYNPAYFNNNHNAFYSLNSDSSVLMLYGENSTDLSNKYFLSITNDTLDDRAHQGIIIPSTAFLSNYILFAMMGNTHIFVFTANSLAAPGTEPIVIRVFSIPISDVKNQVSSPVFTQITGWTTNSFYGDVFNSDTYINLINRQASTNVADKPFYLYPATLAGTFLNNGGGLDFFAAQDKTTGLIRFKVVLDTFASLSSGASIRPKSWFNMSLNLTTKVASVENVQAGTPLVVTDSGGSLLSSGWALLSGSTMYNGMVNSWYSYYISIAAGRVYVHRSGTTADESNTIKRAFYNNPVPPTSLYDAINISYTYSNSAGGFMEGTIFSSYASAVGGALRSCELLPNNNVKLVSNNNVSAKNAVRSLYGTPANYAYRNYDNTTTLGFAPSVNRSVLSSSSKVFMSSINTSQVVSTNGGILTEYRLSTAETYDSSAQPVGSNVISTTLNILTTLKSAMVVGIPNVNLSKDNRITLYVPRQSNIPVFAISQYILNDNRLHIRVVEVSVNTRVGSITSATISRVVDDKILSLASVSIPNNLNIYATGVTIYEGSDFYALMISFPYYTTVVGNSLTWYSNMKCPKNTSQLSPMGDIQIAGPYASPTAYPGAIPNHGFGYYDGSLDSTVSYTRIYFRTIGTTQADYDAWTYKPVPPLIVVSQDVPEGFMVYFTQDTPVVISGITAVLPVSNVDLHDIKANPANSTFHVYVVVQEGLVQYKITEEIIPESQTSMWLGTITTNNLQVSSINIDKRSRLDLFGPSTEPAGSSFPVSYGIPSQTGTINW